MADARGAMLRLSALVGERTLFENDAYRKLWLGRLLSHTPVNAVLYTMLILVVEATGRSFASSLFVAAYIAPTAALGTVSGVLADRMPKAIVLAGTNALRAALCVLLAMSTGSVWTIYLIAVLFATCSQFSGPAEASALPSVVEREDLTAANSLSNLGGLLSQLAGFVLLPAVFLNTVGAGALAIVCAAMFLAAAVNFLAIEGLGGAGVAMPASLAETRERFAEAWDRLAADSVAYVAVVITVLANTAGLVLVTLMPRYSTEVLEIRTENVVFVAAPAALGIWLALRFVRRLSGRVSPRWSVGGSFALLVTAILLLAFVRPIGRALEDANVFGLFDPGPFGQSTARIMVTMVIGAGLAFAFTFVNVVGRSIVNERMPREMQGRIFAAQHVLTNLASIPPVLLAGALADLMTVPPVYVAVAVVSAISALYFAARNAAAPVRAVY